jgi:UDP-glucose 4-epimerase
MTKTIGITGAAGFIGSNLTAELLRQGYSVVALDNLSMGHWENLQHVAKHPRFRFVHADVRDSPSLRAAFADVDALVHLAAFKIPRYGNALDTLLINTQGMSHVLEVAQESGCKVVAASTSDVYGKNTDLPFHEESDLVLGPSTVRRWSYAVSKLFNEHLCLAYKDACDLAVVSLRFFGSYGPREHRSWWGGPQSVFIESILDGRPIEIHGDGQQTRTFTYVADTVDGIIRALEQDTANGEILNIGSEREISILSLAQSIVGLIGQSVPFRFVDYGSFTGKKYEDVRQRIPCMAKARHLLGFRATTSLEDGLVRTIDWHRKVRTQHRI